MYEILHRGVKGNMDKELTKLRGLICSIFRTRTISYLDLSIFRLDPMETSIKMAIRALTMGKKKGERIREQLEVSIRQMLMRWKARTGRLGWLLNDFQFSFEEITTPEIVQNENFHSEKLFWKENFMKPLMNQYRLQLAKHSREEEEEDKMNWIIKVRIRSIAQFVFWKRKMDDIVEQGQTEAQKHMAIENIKKIKRVMIKTAEILGSTDKKGNLRKRWNRNSRSRYPKNTTTETMRTVNHGKSFSH